MEVIITFNAIVLSDSIQLPAKIQYHRAVFSPSQSVDPWLAILITTWPCAMTLTRLSWTSIDIRHAAPPLILRNTTKRSIKPTMSQEVAFGPSPFTIYHHVPQSPYHSLPAKHINLPSKATPPPGLKYEPSIAIVSFSRTFRCCPTGLRKNHQYHASQTPNRREIPELSLCRAHHHCSSRPSTRIL